MNKREDRRGHWPSGKRRSDLKPKEYRQVIARIRIAIDRGLSRRAVAIMLGVSDHTIRRWLSGEDYPLADSVRSLGALSNVRVK